jgi:FKBP-type peptidyl-prolyl cis-trans isomerase
VRKSTALIAAFAVLASLSACTSTGAVANGCGTSVVSGDASAVIKATGKAGTAPSVSFPTPLHVSTTQKTQLIAGKGAPIQDGQSALYHLTVLNGTDGKIIQKGDYSSLADGFNTVSKGGTIPAVSKGLKCATAGSRIAIVGDPKDSHDNKEYQGIAKNDALVFLIDVVRTFPAKADGAGRPAVSGFPSVVFGSDGTPGISVPTGAAPKSFRVEQLKQGDGKKVANGSIIVAKYTAVAWADHSIVDSTWAKGPAAILQVGSQSLPTGLSKALVGQNVGSQFLAVLPPKDTAVADGSGTAPAGSTLVYVVDVLGIIQ